MDTLIEIIMLEGFVTVAMINKEKIRNETFRSERLELKSITWNDCNRFPLHSEPFFEFASNVIEISIINKLALNCFNL